MKILLIFSLSIISWNPAVAMGKSRFELLTGKRKAPSQKAFWDKKYSNERYVFGKAPAQFLAENYKYIPPQANVLDLGMGEGRNAVFLARQGYKVTGIDISSVAVRKARKLAREFGVRINTIVGSLDRYEFPDNSFDAIICFYFVKRDLHEKMLRWLKPGGLLMYEAHTDDQKKVKGSEFYDRKFLLRKGELLRLFPDLKVLKYEEPLHRKEFTASLIGQK